MSLTSIAPVVAVQSSALPTGLSNPTVATTAAAALTAAVPIPEPFTTIQDFAALFKALASGSVSRSQAALATVLNDIAAQSSPLTTTTAASTLTPLLQKLGNTLSSAGPDAALNDIAAFLVHSTPTTGALFDVTL